METLITKQALRATGRLTQTTAALARLLDQTMNDIQAVDSEFQEQVLELVAERDLLRQELEQLQQAASGAKAERARLAADYEHANRLLEQSKDDHDRALAETDEAAAIALEMQIATAVDRVRADLKARWDADRAALVAELEQARHAAAPTPEEPGVDEEVARIKGLIQTISHVVEDPDTELSVVIRKNAERAELESYLRGLRFKVPGA